MSFWFSFLSLSLQSHYHQNYSCWRAPCTDAPVTLRPQPRRGRRCAGDGREGLASPGVAVSALVLSEVSLASRGLLLGSRVSYAGRMNKEILFHPLMSR